jgi:Na+/proline symporter/signal transduction histidine kinase
MFEGWNVIALAFAYVGALFTLAWVGDRTSRLRKGGDGRPLIYALSIAVYCTSWTFFGSVGLAATTGYDFFPVYLGAIVLFAFGWPLILRVVRLAKSQNITSVSDFLAARYGKSQWVAAVVAIIAVIGTIPYISLQLKAVSFSVDTLLGSAAIDRLGWPFDTAFFVAIAMALFTMMFGTRHIDATEHQHGLMLAVAAESLVKLAAFVAVGSFIAFSVFGGASGFFKTLAETPELHRIFLEGLNAPSWITLTLLSFVAVLLLPRQFHVIVVENTSEREVRRAAWLFPLYLVAINIFVVPIAVAGLVALPRGTFSPDTFVLALPIHLGSAEFAVIAFIGGLSAATAMVIVDAVALAIMVCNGLVVPLLLNRRVAIEPFMSREADASQQDMSRVLLSVRRTAILVIILLSYLFYRLLGSVQGLASIGLVSFAAIAQLAPAFFGGLMWRKATARGAIAGIIAGTLVWAYTLLVPWVVQAGLLDSSLLSEGPFGWRALAPQALLYLRLDPLSHGVLWSLLVNISVYVSVSLLRAPEPIERLQAHVFVADDQPAVRSMSSGAGFRLWRTNVTAGDLQRTVARYLGAERAERSFAEFAASRSAPLAGTQEADVDLLRFTEHLLASAIGAASSRLVLSLLLNRGNVGRQSALRLLDDASEALQYNRDLLQSALDQVRHGLSVFDKEMRLVTWNRQFRELLDLPPDLGKVGVPLDRILRMIGQRGDLGRGNIDALVADRLVKLTVSHETFHEYLAGGKRVIEVRTAPMPQGGIVTTYSDITERMEANEALARANETLERRVRERTAELTEVNRALEIAKALADEASHEKTRFLAAASHDVLQPLNAARLYASSLAERQAGTPDASIARNIDASLEAVEEILGALIEIARLDTGRMDPEVTSFALSELLEQLAVEFFPLARESKLELRILPTTLWVRSDRRLMRRVFQNLVSNAIKYTRSGGVLVAVRRRGDAVVFQVSDTGPGIPQDQQLAIFKEFKRLAGTEGARGLGLGLSIVDRISRMLGHPVEVASRLGRGSTFRVVMPGAEPIAPTVRLSAAVPAAVSRLTGLKVLCVDNEPAVLDGMRTLLTGWGCQVFQAASTAQVRNASILAEPPDIVLADYHLDVGTGLDAIMVVRQRFGGTIPAIVITADNSPEVQREITELGYGLLRKPLKAAALRALITQSTLQRMAAE